METKKKPMTRYTEKTFHLHQFVVPFLLIPFFLWDTLQYIVFILRQYFRRSGTHMDRVGRVQKQVHRWRDEGNGRKMCTARPSWMSITQQKIGYKDKMYRVAVDLEKVIEVNPEEMTVTVEPSVSIGFLNRFLVSKGWTLPVVPELDCLTIGGLVMGGGIESTSHKYGLWHMVCLEYELVTADGEIMKANAETNSDVYLSVPFSYGTLGFLTAVKLQMIKYKPFIKLTYRPTYSLDETIHVLDHQTNKENGNDSVEGIVYNKNQAVIMTGEFVEEEEVEHNKINRIGLWFKPWFYKHVQTFIKKGETVEYIPTLHFHQRHNKSCFWLAHVWVPWAHNIIARLLTGWLLPMNTQLLSFLKETFIEEDHEDDFILQDFIIPINHLKAGIQLSAKMTDVWPLWLVPTKIFNEQIKNQYQINERKDAGGSDTATYWPERFETVGDIIHIDLGVYGHSPLNNYMGRDETLRVFEKFTLEHNGAQALYAETLLTYEEFSKMFCRKLYNKVRDRLPYCNQAFPTVYQKVSRLGRQGVMK